MRRWIIAATALVVLAVANVDVYQKEQLLATGRTVLLELAPVDPRSLLQGDYMALRFRVLDDAFGSRTAELPADGRIVVAVDTDDVGSFRRFDDGTPLETDEALMRYRVRGGTPRLSTDAFFFQEGHAELYAPARYGEFRVAADGEALLVALRGPDGGRIGEQVR